MSGRSLDQYKKKRDFDATPEPAGEIDRSNLRRFVIQQHSATRLHWDLRLEHEGVLLSWAMPRGLPWNPKDNHLAVHTEDHPLQYLDFHGDIPAGSYGAGNMFVWDTGTYETEKLTDTKATIVLHGEKAEGKYALFQTRGRDWIIHRMDPPADPTRRPLPEHLELVEPIAGELPKGKAWAYEVQWSGARVLVACSGGVVTISDRAGNDISTKLPEIRRLGRHLGMTEVILDGVIVDPGGETDRITSRLALKSASTIRRHAADHPASLVAFDLLWLDGHPTTEQPWRERRKLLDDLGLDERTWQVSSAHEGDGSALLAAAKGRGLPGLIAKRTADAYVQGAWVRVNAGD